MSLLIKNAMIVNANKHWRDPQDVLVEKGLIVKVSPGIKQKAIRIIDAKGLILMPGLIDMHSHLRVPGQEYKETIKTGAESAAKGGFTTILCMPNTRPVIDNRMVVEGILKEAKKVGLVNIFPIGSVTKGQQGEELSDIFELKEAGCIALSDDGKSVKTSQLMRHALEYAKMVGIPILEHCEDESLCAGVMNEGGISTLLGLKGVPDIAETVIIARDIELAYYLKTRVHFCHISSKRSVELVRFAKGQGIQVSAEVCPHHFSLTDEAVKSFDTNTKVNPPLRTQKDVEALKRGLKDNIIDCIATDHAPHSAEEKELDFDHAPVGMIGFETALGLAMRELVEAKILSLSQLIEKMSTSPAKLVGLNNKGEIQEGKDADMIIVDPEKNWIFRKEDILSKSKNSPFVGQTLKGKVLTTICGGKVVYQEK